MLKHIAIAGLALSTAGCATDEYQRIDGMTPGVGNSIAANTVMQMVDPWPIGVDDTDIETPADHAQYKKVAGAEASDEGGSGSSTSGSGGTASE